MTCPNMFIKANVNLFCSNTSPDEAYKKGGFIDQTISYQANIVKTTHQT